MSIKKVLAAAVLAALPVMASAGSPTPGTVDNSVDDPLPAMGSLGSSAAAPVAAAVAVLAVGAAIASKSSSSSGSN